MIRIPVMGLVTRDQGSRKDLADVKMARWSPAITVLAQWCLTSPQPDKKVPLRRQPQFLARKPAFQFEDKL